MAKTSKGNTSKVSSAVEILRNANLERFNELKVVEGSGKTKKTTVFGYKDILASVHKYGEVQETVNQTKTSFDGQLLVLGKACKGIEDWRNVKLALYQVYKQTYNNEPIPNAFMVSCSQVGHAIENGKIAKVESIGSYAKERNKASKEATKAKLEKAKQEESVKYPMLNELMTLFGHLKLVHIDLDANNQRKMIEALNDVGANFAKLTKLKAAEETAKTKMAEKNRDIDADYETEEDSDDISDLLPGTVRRIPASGESATA